MSGVLDCKSGYAGTADLQPPTYKTVCNGDGHTEAIMITYDDEVITFEQLVNQYFDYMKTQPFIRDGQYANKIWTNSDKERIIIAKVGMEKGAMIPTISPFEKFYKAELYHQDFQKKNGVRYLFLIIGIILR